MEVRTPTAEALTQLILEVFRLNGDLLVAGNRITKPSGQTSARWQVLGALRSGPLPVSAIAREMGLARQSVQRTADLLAGDGIVEFVDNPAHRRAKLVRPTYRGQEVLGQISQRQVAWTNALSEALPFGEKRVREALEVLRHLHTEIERGESLDTNKARARASDRSPIDRKEWPMADVVLINPFEVPLERGDEFLAGWSAAADYMSRQPGFEGTRLHRALSPDARFGFINVAEWESPKHFQAAVTSPEFAEMTKGGPPGNPSLYEVVRTIEAGRS